MQNAKDTFYVTLRDRLATINPTRTIVVRGITRPGLLVEENELPSTFQPVDSFCLQWAGIRVASRTAMALVSMQCEIRYSTDGNAGNGGMDRGRLLAGMDAELIAAVNAAPQNVVKSGFTAEATSSTALETKVFWGDLGFGPLSVENERLERVATVEVFAYQEAGEL